MKWASFPVSFLDSRTGSLQGHFALTTTPKSKKLLKIMPPPHHSLFEGKTFLGSIGAIEKHYIYLSHGEYSCFSGTIIVYLMGCFLRLCWGVLCSSQLMNPLPLKNMQTFEFQLNLI